jgi:hypothetical protein
MFPNSATIGSSIFTQTRSLSSLLLMQQPEQVRFRKVFTILADLGFTKLYLGLVGFPNGKATPEPS